MRIGETTLFLTSWNMFFFQGWNMLKFLVGFEVRKPSGGKKSWKKANLKQNCMPRVEGKVVYLILYRVLAPSKRRVETRRMSEPSTVSCRQKTMVVQLHKNTTPFSFVHWGNPQQWLFHVPMNCWRRYAERSKQLLLKQRWSRITGRNTPETSIHQQITDFFNFLLFCLKSLQSESLDNGVEVAFRSGCQMTPRLDTLNPWGSDLDHFGHSKKKTGQNLMNHLRSSQALWARKLSLFSWFFGDFCYGGKKKIWQLRWLTGWGAPDPRVEVGFLWKGTVVHTWCEILIWLSNIRGQVSNQFGVRCQMWIRFAVICQLVLSSVAARTKNTTLVFRDCINLWVWCIPIPRTVKQAVHF